MLTCPNHNAEPQLPFKPVLPRKAGLEAPVVPDLSLEVDVAEAIHHRAQDHGHGIICDLLIEPWGVKRFFLSRIRRERLSMSLLVMMNESSWRYYRMAAY